MSESTNNPLNDFLNQAEEESEGENSTLRMLALVRVEANVYEAWNAIFLPLKAR